MELPALFNPPRRRGLVFLSLTALVLTGAGWLSIALSTTQQEQTRFTGLLLFGVVLLIPVPLILYGAYSLLRGQYILEREGLRLRWGLRAEDIPMSRIEWVRPIKELGFRVPLPFLRFPGAILGNVRTHELGEIEFLASDADSILLIATPEKIYAISPENVSAFMRAYRYVAELGSLQPISSQSIRPMVFLAQIWDDPLARRLILAGGAAFLLLLASTGIAILTRTSIPLGYSPQGTPLAPVPSIQLLLLPVLGLMFLGTDWITGVYFYRQQHTIPAAYLLWGTGAVTAFLFLLALWFFLLRG
ncbi:MULTISPECIES: PH domain-containing protein [Anaerolinea]|uniref:PH domain-containing protein n=1 Tax=Anaerolinea TaxID=233189 RepID=UPI0026130660|nr:PH domain-containing protein [Anaerolinea thermophila]